MKLNHTSGNLAEGQANIPLMLVAASPLGSNRHTPTSARYRSKVQVAHSLRQTRPPPTEPGRTAGSQARAKVTEPGEVCLSQEATPRSTGSGMQKTRSLSAVRVNTSSGISPGELVGLTGFSSEQPTGSSCPISGGNSPLRPLDVQVQASTPSGHS